MMSIKSTLYINCGTLTTEEFIERLWFDLKGKYDYVPQRKENRFHPLFRITHQFTQLSDEDSPYLIRLYRLSENELIVSNIISQTECEDDGTKDSENIYQKKLIKFYYDLTENLSFIEKCKIELCNGASNEVEVYFADKPANINTYRYKPFFQVSELTQNTTSKPYR